MSNKKYISELYSLYEEELQPHIITDEFSKVRRLIINKTDELNKDLTDVQKDLLQEILELEHHKGALEDEQVFIYAFRLAVKLILGSLVNEDERLGECICKKV